MGKLESPELDVLLVRARSDPHAFAAVYRAFERRLLAFLMRATGRPELAADLAAETFARALEAIDSYDETRGTAEQWLFGIARNLLASSYRRGSVEAAARQRIGMPLLIVDDHASETITRLAGEEGEATLALAQLPDGQRAAIDAHVLDDRDYAEIATELRCSEEVVRQRVSRGLRTLRTRLADLR